MNNRTDAPRHDLTAAAVQALERLRQDLGARHRIPGGPISANADTAIMRLPGLSIFCHSGQRFTWDNGRDEHEQVKLGQAAVNPLHLAADLISTRWGEVHDYQPTPAGKTG